jgi:hypothetical protein
LIYLSYVRGALHHQPAGYLGGGQPQQQHGGGDCQPIRQVGDVERAGINLKYRDYYIVRLLGMGMMMMMVLITCFPLILQDISGGGRPGWVLQDTLRREPSW